MLENQKSMLNDALIAEQNRKKCSLTLSDIIKFLNNIIGDVSTPDARSKLLDIFVDKIYIYPDKLMMTFFYSDDRRELPFAEMERLINNQQSISAMLDGRYDPDNVSLDKINDLIGYGEEPPDFFL